MDLAKIMAKAIFYASIQASWGSVEMSSKFSVMNFSKDQETLQRAADALRSYLIIALFWTFGTVLAMYASYGVCGAWLGLAANAALVAWIVLSYVHAFKEAAKNNNLKIPIIFKQSDYVYIGFLALLLLAAGVYSTQKGLIK